MLIPPKYNLTSEISKLLSSIEASKEVIDSITIPPEIEQNIRRQSTLKSALFSARIEGNPLTLEELSRTSKTQKKLEVMNLLKAKNYLYQKSKKDISTKEILTLHEITMKGLTENKNIGKFRTNMEAIFNSAGIAIYMPPPPKQVPSCINRLIKYMKSEKEKLTPVKAVISHFIFEKIHPFLDGSGRVGRLVLEKILLQGGYAMKGLLSLEEYIDNHRNEYYRMLEEPEKELTEYVTFMLEVIGNTALKAKQLVLQKRESEATDFLLPRRAEIYNIIKDHKLANFDIIRRRFKKVNQRTLRYDLKKLIDGELIIKLGTTRGVYYKIK